MHALEELEIHIYSTATPFDSPAGGGQYDA